MVFFAQKALRKIPGNWTFVIVTDRVELDEQIAKTFAACGAVSDATACHAQSGAQLRELLSGNNRYVFTLIHKFQSAEVLCDRRDVIVLTDMLDIYPGKKARFVKNYMQGADSIADAVARYVREVKDGSFPEAEHSF